MTSETGANVLGCGLMIFRTGLGLLAGLFHLWTIVIAYNRSGSFAATVSCFLPVLSEIYWAITLIRISGQFLNPYTIFMLGILVLWGIFLLFATIAGREDQDL